MQIKNCKNCGKIYNYYGGNLICPSCQKKLEETFSLVKQYINDNEDTTVEEVSVELHVPVKQIYSWIREERISFKEESLNGITCERCGISIKTGCYCMKCKNELYHSFLGDSKSKDSDQITNQKMRFVGKK